MKKIKEDLQENYKGKEVTTYELVKFLAIKGIKNLDTALKIIKDLEKEEKLLLIEKKGKGIIHNRWKVKN